MNNCTFKLIDSKNIDRFKSFSKSKELKEYWSQHQELKDDFSKISEGENQWEYWVSGVQKPVCLVIRKLLVREEEEKLTPWLEEEMPSYWIDFIPLAEISIPPLIEKFLELSDTPSAFLTDPESREEEKVALWEQLSFKRVGSLIKGQGFFKGTSHYVMKRFL